MVVPTFFADKEGSKKDLAALIKVHLIKVFLSLMKNYFLFLFFS